MYIRLPHCERRFPLFQQYCVKKSVLVYRSVRLEPRTRAAHRRSFQRRDTPTELKNPLIETSNLLQTNSPKYRQSQETSVDACSEGIDGRVINRYVCTLHRPAVSFYLCPENRISTEPHNHIQQQHQGKSRVKSSKLLQVKPRD